MGHIEIFEIVVHTRVIKSVDRVRILFSNGNGTAGMCAWIADNYLFVGNKSWMLHSHLLWDLPGEILCGSNVLIENRCFLNSIACSCFKFLSDSFLKINCTLFTTESLSFIKQFSWYFNTIRSRVFLAF